VVAGRLFCDTVRGLFLVACSALTYVPRASIALDRVPQGGGALQPFTVLFTAPGVRRTSESRRGSSGAHDAGALSPADGTDGAGFGTDQQGLLPTVASAIVSCSTLALRARMLAAGLPLVLPLAPPPSGPAAGITRSGTAEATHAWQGQGQGQGICEPLKAGGHLHGSGAMDVDEDGLDARKGNGSDFWDDYMDGHRARGNDSLNMAGANSTGARMAPQLRDGSPQTMLVFTGSVAAHLLFDFLLHEVMPLLPLFPVSA
jgi:hypothetical protein